MKTPNLKKKKNKANQHYSKIASLSHGFTDKENNGTMKQWNNFFLFLFVLLLPTQLGKHFFFDFSYLSGVRVDYLAPTIYLTDILAFLLFLVNFKTIRYFLGQRKVLILFFLLFFSVLVSQFPPVSMYRYIKFAELIGIYFIFRQAQLSKRLLLSGLLIGGIFEFSLSLAQFANKHSLQGLFYFFGERRLDLSLPGIAKASLAGVEILRPYGTFSHPNSMAGFYLLVYFFLLSHKKFTDSLLKNSLLLVSSLLIFLSFSKTAITFYIILNFIYLWRSPLIKTCKLCLLSRIFVLSIVSLVFLQATTDPLTIQKRLQLMQNALSIIAKRPLFGVGLGNYLLAQQQFPQRFADFLNQPVHNIFLLLLSEIGIAISVVLFFIFRKEFKIAFKNSPYIFLAVLLTGLLDHYWLTLQQNFLLIGLILGVL